MHLGNLIFAEVMCIEVLAFRPGKAPDEAVNHTQGIAVTRSGIVCTTLFVTGDSDQMRISCVL